MLVFVTSRRHAGKTFVLVADGDETVARLFAYLFHTFFDMRIVAAPFILKHKGKFLEPHTKLKDIVGTDRSDLYVDLVETRKDIRDASAWDAEHPPFILSEMVAATLHRERLALAMAGLADLPQFSEIGAFTISMPPEAKRWAVRSAIAFSISAFALTAIAALNTLYYIADGCATNYCEFRSVGTLLALWLMAMSQLTIAILTSLAQANFGRKAGDRIAPLLLSAGFAESAIDSARHPNMLHFTQEYVGMCASNIHAFIQHNGHTVLAEIVDQVDKGETPVLLHTLTSVARTDEGMAALARLNVSSPLARAVTVSPADRHPLLLALIARLYRAIPTAAGRADVLEQLLVSLLARGTLLTAEDVTVAASLVHTALAEELVKPHALGGSLNEMVVLLTAAKDSKDCQVLLSSLGRVLKARPAVDSELLLDIIRQLRPTLQHPDVLVRALAVAVFQICLRNDAVLAAACEDPELWSALPTSLDARLSAAHTHSCRCAAVLLAIVARAADTLPAIAPGEHGDGEEKHKGHTTPGQQGQLQQGQEQQQQQQQQQQGQEDGQGQGDKAKQPASSSSTTSEQQQQNVDGVCGDGDGDGDGALGRHVPPVVELRRTLAQCVQAALRFDVSNDLQAEGQALLASTLHITAADAFNTSTTSSAHLAASACTVNSVTA
ncbi:hypothetical protein PTSG_08976 [Salpingoeca rosetta]|uniref:Uncharacterized protein n=1 Tax=Salpingoeca rosetta (strain ATCC 50818 / BSB-021) TaxID=946362 RepID=F2ULU9_SALR5|nr:uncharacterized protein PTSG_08976 [Salpingoeca rosetta]EGD78098.1 hypothetical protein PTSG_08976 [Salpingoeca rosetta]|eukprot:XP_004989774.1 hypothetical protein PTSG_08976 [Salpingoeca rosetta]